MNGPMTDRPIPIGPCVDCLLDVKKNGPKRHPLGLEYFYCPHHRVGGSWQISFWIIFTPTAECEYLQSVEIAAQELSRRAALESSTKQS